MHFHLEESIRGSLLSARDPAHFLADTMALDPSPWPSPERQEIKAAQETAASRPIDYRTKEGQVAAFIREGIISGRFPRGAHLKQQEIADLLKLSITPVREALKLLEAEGYLTGGSYRGATVAPFDPGASHEILQLRITLESQLTAAASRKITTGQIATLKSLADDFARAAETHESISARALNYRFHFFMYEIAELPQTLHFVQVLWARYPFDLIHRIEGRVNRAVAEHAALLEQLLLDDLPGAMLTMRRHIEEGWSELRDHLRRSEAVPPPKNRVSSLAQ